MNTAAKFLHQMLTYQISQYVKRVTHHDQEGFITGIQGCLTAENQLMITIFKRLGRGDIIILRDTKEKNLTKFNTCS